MASSSGSRRGPGPRQSSADLVFAMLDAADGNGAPYTPVAAAEEGEPPTPTPSFGSRAELFPEGSEGSSDIDLAKPERVGGGEEATPRTLGLVAELRELSALHDEGGLSAEEFGDAKAAMILQAAANVGEPGALASMTLLAQRTGSAESPAAAGSGSEADATEVPSPKSAGVSAMFSAEKEAITSELIAEIRKSSAEAVEAVRAEMRLQAEETAAAAPPTTCACRAMTSRVCVSQVALRAQVTKPFVLGCGGRDGVRSNRRGDGSGCGGRPSGRGGASTGAGRGRRGGSGSGSRGSAGGRGACAEAEAAGGRAGAGAA